mmetsp:Transcript_34911/g.57527  ORF Transcript_34911/g.57527 Transcript_34911/m.57527 type:complete len:442 (-) Transcript_34911:117-1442(-)
MANGLDIGAKMAEAKGRNAALLSAARKNLDLTVLSPTGGGKNELATQARFSRVKAGVLLALVVQNTLLVTLMRYTRSRRDRPLYSSGAAIVANEALKLVLSVGLLAWEHGGDPAATLAEIHAATVGGPRELAKMAVPAGLFTAQNFLGYLALSNLPPATYQLLSQGKILTTAAFSVALLGKALTRAQWVSLALLLGGVAAVQTSGGGGRRGAAAAAAAAGDPVKGVLAVFTICAAAGLAGVYFEKLLKGSARSVWARNVQLAGLSLPLALARLQFQQGAAVAAAAAAGQQHGEVPMTFLTGFDGWVWAVVILQAAGGLIVAAVLKHADNILKCFATSASVILSCVASVFLFDFVPTKIFVVGAVTVLAATYMYNNHGGVDSFIEESIACFCVRKRRNSMPEEEFLLSIEEDVKDDMKMRSSIGTTPKSSSTTKNSFSLHNN